MAASVSKRISVTVALRTVNQSQVLLVRRALQHEERRAAELVGARDAQSLGDDDALAVDVGDGGVA